MNQQVKYHDQKSHFGRVIVVRAHHTHTHIHTQPIDSSMHGNWKKYTTLYAPTHLFPYAWDRIVTFQGTRLALTTGQLSGRRYFVGLAAITRQQAATVSGGLKAAARPRQRSHIHRRSRRRRGEITYETLNTNISVAPSCSVRPIVAHFSRKPALFQISQSRRIVRIFRGKWGGVECGRSIAPGFWSRHRNIWFTDHLLRDGDIVHSAMGHSSTFLSGWAFFSLSLIRLGSANRPAPAPS